MKLRHQIFFSGSRQIVQANIMWFSIARQACANSQSTTSTTIFTTSSSFFRLLESAYQDLVISFQSRHFNFIFLLLTQVSGANK